MNFMVVSQNHLFSEMFSGTQTSDVCSSLAAELTNWSRFSPLRNLIELLLCFLRSSSKPSLFCPLDFCESRLSEVYHLYDGLPEPRNWHVNNAAFVTIGCLLLCVYFSMRIWCFLFFCSSTTIVCAYVSVSQCQSRYWSVVSWKHRSFSPFGLISANVAMTLSNFWFDVFLYLIGVGHRSKT